MLRNGLALALLATVWLAPIAAGSAARDRVGAPIGIAASQPSRSEGLARGHAGVDLASEIGSRIRSADGGSTGPDAGPAAGRTTAAPIVLLPRPTVASARRAPTHARGLYPYFPTGPPLAS